MDAYLDIETTGFINTGSYPTVVGIAVDFPGDWTVKQLMGNGITPAAILHILEGVTTIYTFNGTGFDLPFLAQNPGIDLRPPRFEHCDLMYSCRSVGLAGGLKVVEQKIGIARDDLPEMGGADAVRLWHQYQQDNDQEALELLLKYNRADVENLYTLREYLDIHHNRRV